ncbi:prostate androgen-regulated mucin-like protein 1 [Acipenser oxyrinchus oxyrinchus]|uniref:Prostate androgen-regulated mucin-like protein 1 n=1 Tax=Acipenser oxyrinchus oxyrinchus TaxID=40147 RepID=A0AAD8GKH6_ACIOX|nr:prostate androgen-regulated mucin-like protein 1 [Acipenser oxyrinchus oxyrinchus]
MTATNMGSTVSISTTPTTAVVTTSTIHTSAADSTVTSHKVDEGIPINALSSGSVIAIVTAVIAIVLLVFGAAYHLKMRRSSYGRLFDDDYGSVGNFINPLYDNS